MRLFIFVVIALIAILTLLLPEPANITASNLPAGAGDFVGLINSGTLFSLIVALSAYIATLRFFTYGRLSQLGERRAKLDEPIVSPASASAAQTGEIDNWKSQIPDKKKKIDSDRSDLGTFLMALVPADVSLVAAAILLTYHLFAWPLTGRAAPAWIDHRVSILFACAIVVLAIHHMVAWFNSLSKR